MTIKIVTDSTCDLPESILKAYDIQVIPCYINFGPKSYLDGIELTRKEFYEKLPLSQTSPTTSAPGLGTFARLYEGLAASGASQIISIHVSKALSNLANVAQLAAQAASIPVTVIDSHNCSLGTGFLVEAAAQAADAGAKLSEIVHLIEDKIEKIYTLAIVDTTEYLRRSGRVSQFQNNLASLLGIKPLIKLHNSIINMEIIRSQKRAVSRLVELLSELKPLRKIALAHTHAVEKVNSLMQEVYQNFPSVPTLAPTDVSPAIGVHLGPGAVGIICERE